MAYSAGANDPVLAADASVRLIVVNDIPNTAVNGNRGRSQLTAAAASGSSDAPGTSFGLVGDGGVEAVAGTTGGDAVLFGEYLVADVLLTAVKSQTIVDQFAGARPLPGARINYQIVVTASGSGTATATGFSDLIPANTTYVAGSLELNGAALSDTADGDAGTFVSAPAPQVRVTLGDLTRRFRAADDRVRRDHQLTSTGEGTMNGKKAIAALCADAAHGRRSLRCLAADKACVELKTSGETEREVVEQGQKVKRLVPVGKVVPGDEIVWTITATNVCKEPTADVVDRQSRAGAHDVRRQLGDGHRHRHRLFPRRQGIQERGGAAGARRRRHDARSASRRVPRDPLDVQVRVRARCDRVRALSRSRQVTVEQ